jgi:hypothetical protein
VVADANGALTALTAPTSTSVWALGTAEPPGKTIGPGIATGVHWNGHSWSRVTFPKAVKGGIGCAGASSAGNVWAFAGAGLFGDGAPYAGALHLVGGKWQVTKSFTPAGLVSGCSVLGNGNAWVYGLTHAAPGVGTWRLRGRTWSRATTGKFYLVSASEVRSNDVWAIAADTLGNNDVIAYWNGRSWARNTAVEKALPSPSATVSVQLEAINAVGKGNVWIAGLVVTQSGQNTKVSDLVLHLSGGTWHKVAPGSSGYYLPDAVPDGHGGWWAENVFANDPKTPYLMHEAKGRWTRVTLPVPHGDQATLNGFGHVPGTAATLALLEVYNGTPTLKTEILAYGGLPR